MLAGSRACRPRPNELVAIINFAFGLRALVADLVTSKAIATTVFEGNQKAGSTQLEAKQKSGLLRHVGLNQRVTRYPDRAAPVAR